MIAASSNARHLKERMEYINEPYTYSTDNVNGNTKPSKDGGISTANNNQSDTQIWELRSSWEYLCIASDAF